jgi:hypothetical protein
MRTNYKKYGKPTGKIEIVFYRLIWYYTPVYNLAGKERMYEFYNTLFFKYLIRFEKKKEVYIGNNVDYCFRKIN